MFHGQEWKRKFLADRNRKFSVSNFHILCGQDRKSLFCQHFRPKFDYEENTITSKSNEYEEKQKENVDEKNLPG